MLRIFLLAWTRGRESSMSSHNSELTHIVAELNRAAKDVRLSQAGIARVTQSLDELLAYGVQLGASDLLLVTDAPATFRLKGVLAAPFGRSLTVEDIHQLLLPLLSPKQSEELQQNKFVDFRFSRGSNGRFRANVHHQKGTLAGSIRFLPTSIPTLETLHLPATLGRLVERRQGLVLITGPTGSGKSSTLAALIHLINVLRKDHIITIEDPIEYIHTNHNCLVEQIEVGPDALCFLNSLRSILRQAPDVILVGEMRDPETIATVLTAAETGHLVFSTLHTNDTSQAVLRVVDSVPTSLQRQVRQQLSLALLAVIAQQLLPATEGNKRYPAVEILIGTPAVRNLIRKGEDHQIYSSISTGRSDGMITMEQSLAEMIRAKKITAEAAFAHCSKPDELRRFLE